MKPARILHRLVSPLGGALLLGVVLAPPSLVAAARPLQVPGPALARPHNTGNTTTTVPDPSSNITPVQAGHDFMNTSVCRFANPQAVDNSTQCTDAALDDINYAHAREGKPAISLPADWDALTIREQMATIFNLERASFGLTPLVGLATTFDQDAATGAKDAADPVVSPFEGGVNGGSIAAWGFPNALAADFAWMYDDGWGGSQSNTLNGACTSASASGCWGHREIILTACAAAGVPASSCQYLGGAAETTANIEGAERTSFAAVVVSTIGPIPPLDWRASPIVPHGYWLVAGDGGIFTFGQAAFLGSTGNLVLQRPVVGMTPTSNHLGYWMVATDGGMFAFHEARFYGSIPGIGLHPAGSGLAPELAAPIVAMVASPDGRGYLLVASDGGVFAFGDAKFHGSCPDIGGCSGPVVAVVPDAGELGYWVVTATGHVYTFGDAAHWVRGTTVGAAAPITGAVASSTGHGFLLADAKGQVFAFGDAVHYGSTPTGITGANPIRGIVATDTGKGYWLMGATGEVYNYGDAPSDGSMAGKHLNAPIVTAAGF